MSPNDIKDRWSVNSLLEPFIGESFIDNSPITEKEEEVSQ
jgi:hypothetical protein